MKYMLLTYGDPGPYAAARDPLLRAHAVWAAGRLGRLDLVRPMLGTEEDGLSSRWLAEADEAVCIPMAPGAMAAGVDSLNVVAAAAVACSLLAVPHVDPDELHALARRGTGDPHQVARVDITISPGRHREVEGLVAEIRKDPPHVVGDAGGAGDRTDQAVSHSVLG